MMEDSLHAATAAIVVSRNDNNSNIIATTTTIPTTSGERPVPQPRRLLTPTSPPIVAAYENVRIDASVFNKSTPLNNENLLHDNVTNPRPSKVTNDKSLFVFPPTLEAASAEAADEVNGNVALPQSPSSRLIITEMNNLNLDAAGHKNRANKDFEESHKLQNLPVPAPRRMQQQQQQQDVYENNEEVGLALAAIHQQQSSSSPVESSSSSGASPVPYKPVVHQSTTGAISKQHRKVPPLPMATKSLTSTATGPKVNNTNSSVQIAVNTASGVLVDGSEAYDEQAASGGHDLRRNHKLNKSNVSLCSTTSGGSTGGSPKYVKDSPSSLLKALSEAIGERVTVRTKGAAHKLDKIQQSSIDKLHDSTQRLRNVGKSLQQSSLDRLHGTKRAVKNVRQAIGMKIIGSSGGDNMSDMSDLPTASTAASSPPSDKSTSTTKSSSGSYDFDRPQTAPANDALFQSISFYSPLRVTGKAFNRSDLTESSYEVPAQQARKFSEDSSAEAATSPPSYQQLYKQYDLDRNPDQTQVTTNRSTDLPCPTFPAPIWPGKTTDPAKTDPAQPQTKTDTNSSSSDTNNYGRIRRPLLPPVVSEYTEMNPVVAVKRNSSARRSGRNASDYEETQIRFKPKPLDCSSTRATIDSADTPECRTTLDSERAVPSVDFSEAEKRVPRPDRSESWTFYDATARGDDDDDDDDDEAGDGASTPEPIYANEDHSIINANAPMIAVVAIAEPVYGAVFSGEGSKVARAPPAVLQPTTVPRTKRAAAAAKRESLLSLGTRGRDVIREFDPLVSTAIEQICSSKSNELMLLECLLSEETYGSTTATTTTTGAAATESVDDFEDDDDDDDRDNEEIVAVLGSNPVLSLPSLPNRSDSLNAALSADTVASKIPHQNLRLQARDLPNEDDLVAPYLARIEPPASTTDTSVPTRSTNWFVDDDDRHDETTAPPGIGDANKPSAIRAPIDTAVKNFKQFEAPPPYSETETTPMPVVPSSPSASTGGTPKNTITMRSMLSNVFNLKRKSSFSSNKATPVTAPATDAAVVGTVAEKSVPAAQEHRLNRLPEICPRPVLTTRLSHHDGIVIRLPSKPTDDILKEQYKAAAFVRDSRFQAYTDKELKTAKENIPLEHIAAVQCVSQHKYTADTLELHCFEITTLQSSKQQQSAKAVAPAQPSRQQRYKYARASHLYGVAKESERDIWMQRLLEAMTDVLPASATCRFYRAGWCYMKPSVTGQWSGAWCLLQKHKKRLVCYSMAGMNVEVLDLRKARCLVLREPDGDEMGGLLVERGPLLMVDCPPYAIYMVMGTARETKIWRHLIMEVAHNNGPSLKEQQLTKDDVAVLVDKCVNFVYAHGSMSEGIYRKSGSEQAIHKLLQLFRADAFNVQITRAEYSEHDVANALKRFMRDLPERLLGRQASSFVGVAAMQSQADKINAYKELLARLPTIERQTLRKLIGHLNFIASQAARNKMSVENLAIVWGPTLLQSRQQRHSEMGFSETESTVIVDLINLYKNLYQLTADEVNKELIMLSVLQKYHESAETLGDVVKQSGDLKVWICIDEAPPSITSRKDEGSQQAVEPLQANVSLTPTKTAYDVCKELAQRFGNGTEPTALTLSEHILDGDLQRPLHHSERPFDVVLRWSYWPEADRRANVLRVQPVRLMRDVARVLRTMPIVSPSMELRYADVRTTKLRGYVLELSDGRVTVMRRDRSGSSSGGGSGGHGGVVVPVRDIELRNVTVYLGAERKRDLQSRWALTLVERDVGGKCVLRTRESPYFGHVIAGASPSDQLVWFSSIMHSLYGEHILPDAEIIMA